MNTTAQDLIARLALKRHPEGGYYKETYRSSDILPADALPGRYTGPRAAGTAILFLLEHGDFSAWHRLSSDEIWHFYLGSSLTLHGIDKAGAYARTRLGPHIGRDERCQRVVRAGHWFAAQIEEPAAFALVGCTVAPGFDFADFELADRAALARQYPEHKTIIEQLTRAPHEHT